MFAMLLLLAGCGRVNLEDLTPEAAKTQQAEAAIAATAQAAEQEELGSAFSGDPDRGHIKYDTWCTNCHDGDPAQVIFGNSYPFAEYEEFFRTGGDIGHIAYDPVIDLSDDDLQDIVAYIATQ